MFSGIVESLGTVVAVEQEPPGCRLVVRESKVAAETAISDSVSINGCCLTVVDRTDDTLAFQAGPETLQRTNLGQLKQGSRVNLERAHLGCGSPARRSFCQRTLSMAQRQVLERIDEGEWSTFWFSVPRALARQMASKGSIAIDGVSLTIVASEPDRFSVALIPFTLAVTTLGQLKPGDKVNLETDILAKYVERREESNELEYSMTEQAERQTLSFLRKRFDQAGIHPRTDLGQNFLIDLNLLGVLTDLADLGPDDVVLEVGTGTGGLTMHMAPRAAAVVTVEVDRNMHHLASEELYQFPNVTMLLCDVLRSKSRIADNVLETVYTLLDAAPNRRLKLVANLPYHVATPLISNLLDLDRPPHSFVCTVQKEVADRIVSQPGTKDYGSLAIWIQSQCQCRRNCACIRSRACFGRGPRSNRPL